MSHRSGRPFALRPLPRNLVVLAAAFLSLPGCATLTKGTSQTVMIVTDPSGARCEVSRDGKLVAVADPTPQSIAVGRNHRDMAMSCRKDGYKEASGGIASTFQSMTFGNIVFGGLIGVAVDAASGAMHEYPESVTLLLEPAKFTSAAQRDAHFDRVVAMLERETEEVRERTRRLCTTQGSCDAQMAEIDAALRTKREAIAARRDAALIEP